MTDRSDEIYAGLLAGLSVRLAARALRVSTATVQAVRSQYPDKFKPAQRLDVKYQSGRPVVNEPSVPLSVRVPAWIFARIKSEIIDLGLTKSGFINGLLDARYKGQDIYNGFEAGGECSHEPGDVVRNHNSNHDRDEFVCSRCGAKLERGR